MAKNKEIQVELELEDKDKNEQLSQNDETVTDDASTKEDDAQKKIKELQDQMARSDSDRKAAVERADRLEKEKTEANAKAAEAQGRAAVTQKDAINQALESSTKSLEFYRKELKSALEAGDSDKVVEYQEKLSETTYLHSEVKKNKVAYEHWEKQQEEESKRPKTASLPPSVQAWVDRNPKYNSDPEFKAEADTAHDAAIRRGYQFGSMAYIEFIDKRIEKVLGENTPVTKKVVDSDDDEEPGKSFQAPPNRGGAGNSDSGGKKVVKLSKSQREAAEFMGMTDVEYAKYLDK